MITVLTNGMIFDGVSDELRFGHVVIEGGRIVEVSETAPHVGPDHTVIDLRGHTLMPGLIDAHVHAYAPHVDCSAGDRMPMTLVAHWAHRVLTGWLRRGFTTVRDTGGADQGLRRAIDLGWIEGPRLVYCGKLLTEAGGGADFRDPEDHSLDQSAVCYEGIQSRVVSGPDSVRAAVREELRRGGGFIKVLASGSIASPGASVDRLELSDAELMAAVDETSRHGTYVTAHAHQDAAVRRCIDLGIPSIEHASMITESTAALAAARNVTVVPTLSVLWALAHHGAELGLPAAFLEKMAEVEPAFLKSATYLRDAGVRTGFGTDCLGELDGYQCHEFQLRAQVWKPAEILRQATSVNAGILGLKDVGSIAPGMVADLIAVAGDPSEDLALFSASGRNVPLVLKEGRVVKNEAALAR